MVKGDLLYGLDNRTPNLSKYTKLFGGEGAGGPLLSTSEGFGYESERMCTEYRRSPTASKESYKAPTCAARGEKRPRTGEWSTRRHPLLPTASAPEQCTNVSSVALASLLRNLAAQLSVVSRDGAVRAHRILFAEHHAVAADESACGENRNTDLDV